MALVKSFCANSHCSYMIAMFDVCKFNRIERVRICLEDIRFFDCCLLAYIYRNSKFTNLIYLCLYPSVVLMMTHFRMIGLIVD